MLTITHAAVGAAIGQEIQSPWLAFGIGLVAHIVLDKVPHFFSFEKPLKQIIIWGDAVLTALFLIFLYFFHSANHAGLIFGAMGGVSVDLILVIFFQEKGKIAEWHTRRQIHKDSGWWLATDLALFIIGLTLIIVFRW